MNKSNCAALPFVMSCTVSFVTDVELVAIEGRRGPLPEGHYGIQRRRLCRIELHFVPQISEAHHKDNGDRCQVASLHLAASHSSSAICSASTTLQLSYTVYHCYADKHHNLTTLQIMSTISDLSSVFV